MITLGRLDQSHEAVIVPGVDRGSVEDLRGACEYDDVVLQLVDLDVSHAGEQADLMVDE